MTATLVTATLGTVLAVVRRGGVFTRGRPPRWLPTGGAPCS